MVVGTRWQRRKRRFRILVNFPNAVQAQRSVSSGWRQKIRSLRSSSGRFPCSATYAARAKLSLFSAVISFARSEDRQPHLQPRTQRISRNRCTPEIRKKPCIRALSDSLRDFASRQNPSTSLLDQGNRLALKSLISALPYAEKAPTVNQIEAFRAPHTYFAHQGSIRE